MAPEVVNHRKASFQSDSFSLGVTLFELVKGSYPFTPKEIAAFNPTVEDSQQQRPVTDQIR